MFERDASSPAMEIPSQRQLVRYFRGIGIEFLRFECSEDDAFYYRLDDASPFGDRTFPSAENLWREWVALAAFRIHAECKFEEFAKRWIAADDAGRARILMAFHDYWRGVRPSELDEIFHALPASSIDKLPRDWKRQLRKILSKRDLTSFYARAEALMKGLEGTSHESFEGCRQEKAIHDHGAQQPDSSNCAAPGS